MNVLHRIPARCVPGRCFLVLVMALCVSAMSQPRLWSQSAWSKPVILYQTDGIASYPQALADTAGDVHLLFAYHENKTSDMSAPSALMYMRLHQGTWSDPVDVLVSPDSPWANFPAITLDPSGMLHVIWQSGTGLSYHSRAHVTAAGSARGWTQPQLVVREIGLGGDIEATAAGALHIVYAAKSGEIYYYQSADGGASWRDPVQISNALASNSAAHLPRIAASTGGQLHVVWVQNQLPDGTPSIGVFYSTSQDNGLTWTAPYQVDGANHSYIDVATYGTSAVHLSWNASVAIGDRLHQWSSDGGATWSGARLITDRIRGGLTGHSVMSFDSLGRLHLVTSVSGQTGKTEDVYHLMWDNGRWTAPELLSIGTVGAKSVELPAATISSGNQLHVFYEDDSERIWYTNELIDAPALPSIPVTPYEAPARPPASTQKPLPTSTPTLTPSPVIQEIETDPSPGSRAVWLTALLPALTLVVGTVAWRLMRKGRR